MSETVEFEVPYELIGVEWAMEGSDLLSVHSFGHLTTEELEPVFGDMPGPIERIHLRVGLVLDAFLAIDMESPDAGRELSKAMVWLGSNAWPQFLVAYDDDISLAALRYVMPRAHSGWNISPFMGGGPLMMTVDQWLEVWRRAAFVTDGPEAPTEPLRVYRGCGIDDVFGLEWTTDLMVGAKFARAFDGGVYSTVIEPEGVMGRIDDRGESEVVIDPDFIDHEITKMVVQPDVAEEMQ